LKPPSKSIHWMDRYMDELLTKVTSAATSDFCERSLPLSEQETSWALPPRAGAAGDAGAD
jgi:hypothetical protein